MGLFSKTPAEKAERIERQVAVEQHRAFRAAGNQAASRLRGDGGMLPHDQLSEAVADAEADVPWWRRLWDREVRTAR